MCPSCSSTLHEEAGAVAEDLTLILNPSTPQILPNGSQGSKKSRISSAEKKNTFLFLNVGLFFFFLLSLMKSKTLMCLIAPPLQICSDLARGVFSPRLTKTAVVQLDTAKGGGNAGKEESGLQLGQNNCYLYSTR